MENYYLEMKAQYEKETGQAYQTGSISYATWLQVKLLEEMNKKLDTNMQILQDVVNGAKTFHVK